MDCVREEVRSVRNQDDETTLNLRLPSHMRQFQQETRRQSNQKPKCQRAKEDPQKDTDTLEETQDGQLFLRHTRFVFLRRLEKYDGDGVVEDGFAEDDGVEFGVDFVGVEDGEDGDGVGGGKGCADGHGFDEGDVEAFERYTCPEVEDDAEDEGGDEGAGEGEGEDAADVAEEVALFIPSTTGLRSGMRR